MTVEHYTRKPITVMAVQWTGDNLDEIVEWSWDGRRTCVSQMEDYLVVWHSIDRRLMVCEPDWWIVRGILGELYPCETSVFEQSYERAS